MALNQRQTSVTDDDQEQLVESDESETPSNHEEDDDKKSDLFWMFDRNLKHWESIHSIDLSDEEFLLDQFKKFRSIQMESTATRADALDGLAVIAAFLVAFAFGDLVNLETDTFDHDGLFLAYAILLMATVTIGIFVVMVIAMIAVKLRRLLAGDAVAEIYLKKEQLNAFKANYKCASSARAWYFGINRNTGMSFKSLSPNKMVGKAIIGFVIMIQLYILGLCVKCIDLFWAKFEDDLEWIYVMIPILWTAILAVMLLMLLRWMKAMEMTKLK